MGLLVNGEWTDQWYDVKASGGQFVRSKAQFCNRIGSDKFPAEAGRYHPHVHFGF